MARETKVGLLIGVGVILLIAIIVNDHLVTVQTADEPGRLTRFADAAQQELAEGPTPGTQAPPPAANRDAYQSTPTTQARRDAGATGAGTHQIERRESSAPRSAEPTRQSLIPTAEELHDSSWEAPRQQRPPRSAQGLHAAVRVETDTAAEADALDHEQATAQFATPERPAATEQSGVTIDRLRAMQEQAQRQPLRDPARPTPRSTSEREPSEIESRTPPSNAEVIHYVKPGESLWQIAERYLNDGRRWKQIAEANTEHVDENNNVPAGARLVIPSGAALARAAEGGAASRGIDVTPRGGAVPTLYTVKAGDNLYKIAQRTLGDGNRYREIYELNRDQMQNENTLKQGMKLKIPARGDRSRTATASAATGRAAQTDSRPAAPQTYTVKTGDNLYKIAQHTLGDGERYRDIYAANRDVLADENTLEAGQVLKIPG
jgi:nucleoid-associated protein YgaU